MLRSRKEVHILHRILTSRALGARHESSSLIEPHTLKGPIHGGSWDLVTTDNWPYSPTFSWANLSKAT